MGPDAERLAWLRLARTDGVGPVTFHDLLRRFETAQAALSALPDLTRRSGRAWPMRVPSNAEAEAELEAGERLGARLICACEPNFPQALAALDPPPPLSCSPRWSNSASLAGPNCCPAGWWSPREVVKRLPWRAPGAI